eukprot:Clim_evm15s57 gene=Clim_evmTU15s57
MVLGDLGKRLQGALRGLGQSGEVDDEAINAMLKELGNALIQSDVNIKLVVQLKKRVLKKIQAGDATAGANKKRLAQKAVFEELTALLDPGKEPFKPVKGRPNVIMFVGLQGAGKTTTCTKVAYHYARKKWKSCLVCADTFRAGAFDQLKQNAAKARIPFYGSYSESDPVVIAREGVERFKKEGYEIIIVDTSGRHMQEAALFEEMLQLNNAVNPDNIIFVMDGTIGQAAELQAAAFKAKVDVGGVIITKLDGHAKGGGALSAVAATHAPITFIGVGEHMTELEAFDAQRFVGKLLGMGDMRGLMEKMTEVNNQKSQVELAQRLQKGQFSIRDLRGQVEMIMRMGPMSQIMGMMPGGLADIMPEGGDDAAADQMKKFLVMMDSMTDEELDSDGKPFVDSPSRTKRVARGAGVPMEMLEALLAMQKQFSSMVKKMGGMQKAMMGGGGRGRGAGMPMNQANAMQAMQRQVGSMIDPAMLQQMGGMQGLQNMAQQMMGGGMGGGGMADMMQQMQAQMGGGRGGRGGMRGGRRR